MSTQDIIPLTVQRKNNDKNKDNSITDRLKLKYSYEKCKNVFQISRVISKEQANHCNSFYEILVSDRKKNNVPKTNTIGSTHISSIQEDDNTTSEAKGGDVVKKIIMTTT